MAKNKLYAFCQQWIESERGWGQRPDGYSLHLEEKDIELYVKNYYKDMPAATPDVYERTSGECYVVEVDKKTMKKIADSECGIRFYSNDVPEKVKSFT